MAKNPSEILVIHHSHTDVGYTELQSTVASWHAGFIRDALRIAASRPGFKWTCETFWSVEQFLQHAEPEERDQFAEAVRNGNIGLSASYLNFNELLDGRLLESLTARAPAYGRSIDATVDSAMTADINGFGWGFASALARNGIENLFTCIHTHHGMYPLGQRHLAFWWETPNGERVLVWNGEHYHYGNELGLVPGATSSYIIKDECDAQMIFSDHWRVAQIRIPRFLEQLAAADYPYRFVPMMASGLRTDNGPPNVALLDNIERWNNEHRDIATIRMVTLGEFFAELRAEQPDIPTYRGDWPDWWSDGLASYPTHTRIFRQAQRDYLEYHELTTSCDRIGRSEREREIEDNLALYAEHTFSHADSVAHPWQFPVAAIAARKQAYASLAHEQITTAIQQRLSVLGATPLRAGLPPVYRALNPWPDPQAGFVRLPVGHYEYHELGFASGMTVRERDSGKPLIHQLENVPGGIAAVVYLELIPGEIRDLEIVPADRAHDPDIDAPPGDAGADELNTPFLSITWTVPQGITRWTDPTNARELIRSDAPYPAFTPIYERTPVATPEDMCRVRGEMVLNRKGAAVERCVGELTEISVLATGPLYSRVRLRYRVRGTSFYEVEITVYQNAPRVDVMIRIAKDHTWEPENLYVALPFGTGSEGYATWLDKAGAPIRPRIDQLPGSLIDFYCVQAGLALIDHDYGVAVATPDAPLVHIGDLAYRDRILHDPSQPQSNTDPLFSWLMNNYWETNFAAGLGGFYEFGYHLQWGPDLAIVDAALRACRLMNSGPRCFRIGEDT